MTDPDARINILLVDDHPENLTALRAVLADLGENLVEARSGKEALKCVLQDDFAVILLDVQMPHIDGFETARLIRARKRTQTTPIIFVTALSRGEEQILEGYSLGAVDYVFKPIVPQVLRAKVAAFVELAKRTRELQAEVAHRKEVEREVRRLNADLERRVDERTAELQRANERLNQLNRELQEAGRRKDEYLTMLAHELRNPLGAAANAVELLRRSPEAHPARGRALSVVERQIRHQSRLLDDLLDVSRIIHGRIELRTETLDLARLVRDTADDHRDPLEKAGLALELDLPPGPVWVTGDSTRLTQVVVNLLSNAGKFTPPGGTVTLRVEARDERGLAEVSVRDTGSGISAELLPHVFEPFAQADRSLDRSAGGLGLGLSLVQGLVALHRGQVWVHSSGAGQGTDIRFTLPLAAPAGPEPGSPPAARAESVLRVLIVEDNRDAAETLRDLLECAGHTVEVAYSGEEGVQLARRIHPDVVLCDIGLPAMDGYAVARELRRDPATSTARLLAVTGYGSAEDRRQSEEAGFEQHLLKPVDPERLQRLLNDAAW